MFRLIKMIDPNAFVSQSLVIGVYGEGFDEMKVHIKQKIEHKKKMKIVFATNNQNKLLEVRNMLGNKFEVLSLADIGCHDDIPEKGQTLKDNALIKAQYVWDKYHVNCFADDTGLEVDALGGAPGVYSARYAGGEGHDSEANMKKLLSELENVDNRKARFRTVFTLIIDGKTQFFEGICNGDIIREKRGGEGFGYDPIFQPEGYNKTFAELGVDIKNQISHRAQATAKLVAYLKK
jgi:non-canonical purine NTP pyrophosphatase (RdgB/HAM1 family)